ncbi:hypothetical protein E4G67_01395 [Candidatus Bathyarchaeota archaeon]|nr:MAG: hypothetical protein E4G67_01395 [Candidatus Bathyarchaeota archaeon]
MLTVAVALVYLVDAALGVLFGVSLGFAVVGLMAYFGFGFRLRRGLGVCFMLLGVLGLVMFFEAVSLATWIWNIFDYSFPFVDVVHWRFALVDLNLFNVSYGWTSWLFVALLYSWIWIPLGKYAFVKVKSLRAFSERVVISGSFGFGKLSRGLLFVGLFVIIGVAVLVSSYSYFNLAASSLVGSDSAVYFRWLEDMRLQGPAIALQVDRPLSNLFMYFIQSTLGLSSESVVKVMPVVCCVGLSLAVFWFVRVGLRNDVLALTSGLFPVFSFQSTVGIYEYSVSNWLALIEGFILFGLVLKSSGKHSWTYVVAAALVGVALLFTHPYTWDVIVAVLAAYLVWMILRHLKQRLDGKVHFLQLLFVLGVNLVAYGVYSALPFGRAVGSGGIGFVGRNIVLPNLLNLQKGLETMVQMWVGGLYANPLLVFLAILGMFSIVVFATRFSRLMFLWVMVPSLALLVVSAENFMFYRIVYLVPLQILAAIGVFWLLNNLENGMRLKGGKSFWLFRIAVFVLVVFLFVNYALRSVDGAPLHMLS